MTELLSPSRLQEIAFVIEEPQPRSPRPTLICRWEIDEATGRPVCRWEVESPSRQELR
jgi:hypothetical protein